MMPLTTSSILKLREAAREIGEDRVTVASPAGVITFDFSLATNISARLLGYETQPSRQELAAMFGRPA
jgi:hypothetical protein